MQRTHVILSIRTNVFKSSDKHLILLRRSFRGTTSKEPAIELKRFDIPITTYFGKHTQAHAYVPHICRTTPHAFWMVSRWYTMNKWLTKPSYDTNRGEPTLSSMHTFYDSRFAFRHFVLALFYSRCVYYYLSIYVMLCGRAYIVRWQVSVFNAICCVRLCGKRNLAFANFR